MADRPAPYDLGVQHETFDRQERGRQVRALREHYGWSLSAVAVAAGVSKGSLHTVEEGAADMTIGRLCKVAAVLGVPPGRIIERSYPGA